MDEDLKAELTCPICMDLFSEPRRLPCGHVYCRTCLQDMLTRKYLHTRSSERILSCPECRQRYDLTFRDGGIDCFPRDFKLVRLVELYEKRFASGDDAGACSGGGDKGDDDQTAVKTVCSSDTVHETSPAVESSSHPPSAGRQLSREQLEADLHSFGSSAPTLSDDSWIYVSPTSDNRRQRPGPLVIDAQRHSRGDDSWLLPSAQSADARFPVESGQDVRGSVAGVGYRTVTHHDPNLNISGSYENQGRETFQRYAAEPALETRTITRVAAAPAPAQGSTSDSSSESASSDERGEEGSGEDGSESEGSSQRQNRRSRLTRFFRSLVLSDSDSYDDDEEHGTEVEPRGLPPHRRLHHHPQLIEHGPGFATPSSLQTVPPPRGSHPDMSFSSGPPIRSGAESGSQQGTSVAFRADVGPVPQSTSRAGQTVDASMRVAHPQDQTAANGRSSHQGNDGAVGGQAAAQNCSGPAASGGVALATSSTSRGDRVIAADSDDSDDDYEAQTSMLRPKRKPRSRLKKFFTSLLSLSSSDEEEEEAAAQASSQTSPTVTPERN
ncbi:hypothetical protein BaRGS_00023081 [Batillaria attramentaria]|uniref:RING-type domain-containing protein n=1 Tax=Batillaria attramentaria TaxID=370345 RepID=A0ABD0KFI0_9CAEN